MFLVDIAYLDRDVAPARPLHDGVGLCVFRLFEKNDAIAAEKAVAAPFGYVGEAERHGVEAPMRVHVAHAEADADPLDAVGARRHQRHAVAVRIGETFGPEQALARDQQFAIAGRRRGRQFVSRVVDLEHRAEKIVPVLPHAVAQRQHVVEGQSDLVPPEVEHGLETGREEADIDPGFGKVHAGLHFS